MWCGALGDRTKFINFIPNVKISLGAKKRRPFRCNSVCRSSRVCRENENDHASRFVTDSPCIVSHAAKSYDVSARYSSAPACGEASMGVELRHQNASLHSSRLSKRSSGLSVDGDLAARNGQELYHYNQSDNVLSLHRCGHWRVISSYDDIGDAWQRRLGDGGELERRQRLDLYRSRFAHECMRKRATGAQPKRWCLR